ncbi:universal stress protein [Natronobacterium gregoryi]|uniref:Universal stress protein n=2 Tax=Natronobacterium gregoryi TaxID=44930 RepID=L0ADF8_NATGS|nr:universal stress protein [Natronobacterium gregoryi]AFZ71948.1 universal stress protein UspA-like protein [Natronobacterium gregoryi SP2]ELY62557.1 UspA domain-containing protein [Natronobacterium gregoryi SP2]PLK20725.1 universal stress protein [Natronobacterium gregoryi SP2]SFJ13094.1 Nucleotide-binding universal stress protein, UspA family [Natronobacterium gregoryi]
MTVGGERVAMISVDTVLVPTDGSQGAEATIDHAIDLARTYDAAVHALYVVDPGTELADLDADQREDLSAPSERLGREATITITNQVEEHGLETARAVHEGIAHREILAYADEHDVDLIAMGTHGRTGRERARLGSTTERVISLGDVPVLSVRLSDEEVPSAGFDRIVVPTDGSDAAERAARRALELAQRYDAEVRVVYVVDTTIYSLEDAPGSIVGLLTEGGQTATETIAEMARERELSVRTAVRRGVPAADLLEYAAAVDADLVTMGTRGRAAGAESDRLLGSTTARVVARSPVPVLAVD